MYYYGNQGSNISPYIQEGTQVSQYAPAPGTTQWNFRQTAGPADVGPYSLNQNFAGKKPLPSLDLSLWDEYWNAAEDEDQFHLPYAEGGYKVNLWG